MIEEPKKKKQRVFRHRLTRVDDRNKAIWIYYQALLKSDEKYKTMNKYKICMELGDIFFMHPEWVQRVLNKCQVDPKVAGIKPTVLHVEQLKHIQSIAKHIDESLG